MNLEHMYLLYFLIGIILCISELFTLTFYLLPLGVASLLTGLFAVYFNSPYAHAFCFGVLSLIFIVLMKRFRKSKFLATKDPHYHSGLVGSQGVVVSIDKTKPEAKVKIYSDVWEVLWNPEHEGALMQLNVGDSVVVVAADGNKIAVKKI